MAVSRRQCSRILATLLILILLQLSCREVTAIRQLEAEQRLRNNLVIQSLPRGPVPASRSSPCTYIPGGKSRGRCVMAVEAEFSGRPAAAPTAAFPAVMVQFAVAEEKAT